MTTFGPTDWRPASGHPSGWRVVRHTDPDWTRGRMEEAETKAGRVRLFRSYDGAARAAHKLNATKGDLRG